MPSDNPPGPPLLPVELRYGCATERFEISGRKFSMLVVRDVNALLDAITADQFSADERLPYWAELWPSSLALAEYCLEADLRGRRVLELGCGLGLAGIAAARSGAEVVMTDYEEDALAFARHNASLNLSPVQARGATFRHLDWRKWEAGECFDLILGADLVYDRANSRPLLDILGSGLAPDGAAVFADPGRGVGREFFTSASQRGFEIVKKERTVFLHGKDTAIDLITLSLPPTEPG